MILLFLEEKPLMVGSGASAFRLPFDVAFDVTFGATFAGGILMSWDVVKPR